MIAPARHEFPDPFREGEWEAYALPREQSELAQADDTASGLYDFLREEIKQRAERQPEPQPLPEPWRIGSITGFP